MLLQQPPTTLQGVTAFLGLMLRVLPLGFMSEPWGAPEVTEPQPAGRGGGQSDLQKQN